MHFIICSQNSALFLFAIGFILLRVEPVSGSEEEERLMVDLFRGYNSLIQPVKSLADRPLIVRMALQLVLLIDVDEKDQVMHTNVWLTIRWRDFQLQWNPMNYGGIREIRVHPDKVWLPDIVLFNNADGNYEVSFPSNVVVDHKGNMLWVPPAIYKSSCIIDVEYFPFDEQVCYLIFGSWTYNENEIRLEFEAAEWIDIVYTQLDLGRYRCSGLSRQQTLTDRISTPNQVLIIPTVLMAFLNMAVFFLPTDSGEKITLTISVLLSIVVFLLLVSKILPPTSSTIPLMAKYLLLTFALNVITIVVTVVIINIYFRGPTTHRMPKWVRVFFLEFMPRLLCMERPPSLTFGKRDRRKKKEPLSEGTQRKTQISMAMKKQKSGGGGIIASEGGKGGKEGSKTDQPRRSILNLAEEGGEGPSSSAYALPQYIPVSPEAIRAIDAIEYITEHLRRESEYKTHRDDWKYVAMVIDRFLLYVFFGITLGGTMGILFSAPYVFHSVDEKAELTRIIAQYKSGADLL